MKSHHFRFALVFLTFLASKVPAATLYVSLASTNPVPPYADWTTAATNIQDAVDASTNGDLILVTNGIYGTGGRVVYGSETNRVVINRAVTVQSVNGPATTMIVGGTQMRCVYAGSNSMLMGFTLMNGYASNGGDITNEQSGGGAWCESGGVISNCVVLHNFATAFHSGLGGGIYGGTVWNSTIVSNVAYFGGGVASAKVFDCLLTSNSVVASGSAVGSGAYGSSLSNCLLIVNRGDGNGGGAGNCILINSMLSNNSCSYFGGGVYNSTLTNCALSGNSAGYGGGAFLGTLFNCLIISNTASQGGGAEHSTLYNCTVVRNYTAGGVSGYTGPSVVYNSIVNSNIVSSAVANYAYSVTFQNSCTTPLPTNGIGNITNDPAFLNLTTEDFHLSSNSPCINSGNNAYVTAATDLDGNPRNVGGTVDIGAYEYQTPVSKISYSWLDQYGLPITTNIDTSDLDGTGFTVYQDWIAGLNPTNALSVLAMLPPAPTNNPAGLIVSWESVSNITYFLQSSSNLGMQPAFSTIQSNIVGQPSTTTYTDTSATNGGPYFYRVGVQQ